MSMTEEQAPRRMRRLRAPRHWRRIVAVLVLLAVLFCGVTARLFVWPPTTAMPARVDAIVVLGGPGNRLSLGVQLAQQGRAPYLLLSNGFAVNLPASLCQPDHGTFTVICWNPNPGNTKGEVEFVSRMARQHHWTSVALVTTPDQAWRAATLMRRCYSGKIYSMTTPLSWSQWPYEIAYQWGSTIKAETIQRGC
jgi:uncharacterized SAM-binding protein YcdF (DUF218 family)